VAQSSSASAYQSREVSQEWVEVGFAGLLAVLAWYVAVATTLVRELWPPRTNGAARGRLGTVTPSFRQATTFGSCRKPRRPAPCGLAPAPALAVVLRIRAAAGGEGEGDEEGAREGAQWPRGAHGQPMNQPPL
jgi:hypothetical protein